MIAPRPGGNLTSAKAELETLYGKAVSDWKIDSAKFKIIITIPPNTRATVVLPNAAGKAVTESGVLISGLRDISNLTTQQSAIKFNIGSGTYSFEYVF